MVARSLGPAGRSLTRIALSSGELVAADERLRGSGGNSVAGWRTELSAPPTEGVSWPSLGNALRELAVAVGTKGGRLSVALLSPLAEVRRIELPPIRHDERLRLLSRTAGKYFLDVREPQIVGMAAAPRGKASGVVCAAVATRLVACIHAEAAAAGWVVENIVPAEASWIAGAVQLWPAISRGVANILVAHADRIDLLQSEDGRLAGVRRFRTGAADVDEIIDVVASGGNSRTMVFGDDTTRREIVRELAARGIAVTAPPAARESAVATPAVAAASFLAPDERFRLRTDDAVALRDSRTRGVAMRLALSAVALLVTAAAVEWWGVRRELDDVKQQRAAIAAQVSTLLSGQQVSSASARRIAAIAEAHHAVPQWSAAIASLSEELDDGAHLLALRARGDTLLLDGLATRASTVFESVERVPGFSSVRAAGEMRVERQDDGTLLERFTIQARVARSVGKAQ